MLLEVLKAAYFQIRQHSLKGGIFHSEGGMAPLEHFTVPSRGGNIPSIGGTMMHDAFGGRHFLLLRAARRLLRAEPHFH